jgi:predicted membrane-bound spermidine synthase
MARLNAANEPVAVAADAMPPRGEAGTGHTRTGTPGTPRRPRLFGLVALAVGLISAAGLAFEIALTRIFSLLFQYHYAFLALSVAVLGLGLGALAARFLVPQRSGAPAARALRAAVVGLSLAFPLAAVALAWLPSVTSVIPHTLVALIPFVLIGLVSALIFAQHHAESGLLYGADLVGAAVGVTAVLGLLAVWGAFNVAIFLSLPAGAAGLLLTIANRGPGAASRSRQPRQVLGLAAGLLLGGGLLAYNLAANTIDFKPAQLTSAPRDKTMMAVLLDPNASAKLVATAWDPFARVDVVETGDPTSKYVFTDGGAGSFMMQFDGNLDRVAGLRHSLEYLPFTVGSSGSTLILGAGAGKDVLLALLAGSEHITAIEVNPAMVAVARQFAEYNGGILDRPEVNLVVGDARTATERSSDTFDLIYLNLVYSQASEPGSQALVENYLYTREAFRTYLDHLAPTGHLAVISHNALEGSRAALTVLQAMADAGTPIPQALDHLAVYMAASEDPTQRTTLMLFGKQPLTKEELDVLTWNVGQLDLQALFAPQGFELLFAPLRKGTDMQAFLSVDKTYDLSPTDDNRPFFFKLDPGLPAPVVQSLVFAGLLAAGLVFYGVVAAGPGRAGRRWITLMLYASLVGVGFMLIEVPLIQRFQLLLGYPVLSLVTVLGTLLLSAGLGSLASRRWPAMLALGRVTTAAVWIGLIAVIYWVALPALTHGLLAAPLALRLLATVALTAVLGFAMGIPFPSALRLAGDRDERDVPLLWAINGSFSVLGSALAIVLAMSYGFSVTMLAGAVIYLLVAGLAWRLRNQAGPRGV